MANNILEMKKRKQETKQEDDFDPKAWKWSTVIFYIILLGLIMGIFVYKEAHACYEEPEPVIIEITEAI